MPVEDGDWTAFDNQGAESFFGTQGPDPSSNPDQPTEPHPPEDQEVEKFDPKYRLPFEGLLYIGYLEKQFEWLGHQFRIRTLKADEVLEIGLLHREYIGSLSDVKAYQMLMVAACVLSVDGKSLPQPLTTERGDSRIRNAFEYVKEKWYPPTFDVVYERYLLLEAQVEEVIGALGKASGWAEPQIPTSNAASV